MLKNSTIFEIYKLFKKRLIKKKLFIRYKKDLKYFLKYSKNKSRFNTISESPCLYDNSLITPFEPHYTYHPAWAARVLARTKPTKHVDISSILHFSTLISAFIPVDFYDYRPAKLKLKNLNTKKADLTKLPFENSSVVSLSCMHTLEHIGLGRYGDKIDYDGDIQAINELKRVLANNGDLLIVTPIGKSRIEFNAHRIYSYRQIIDLFQPLELVEFALIPDSYEELGLIENASEEICNNQEWGCGCFWFKKIKYDRN